MRLSFGLADTTSHTQLYVAYTLLDATTISRDSAHTLAYKVLQTPMFFFVDMLVPGFVLVDVFHLVSEMLKGKLPVSSLEVAHAITEPFIEEDLAKLRVKLGAEAIATFEENVVH